MFEHGNNSMTYMYKDLPNVLVDSYADVTPALLEKEYERIMSNLDAFNWARLTRQWYFDQLRAVARHPHSANKGRKPFVPGTPPGRKGIAADALVPFDAGAKDALHPPDWDGRRPVYNRWDSKPFDPASVEWDVPAP